jgi:ligand-binding sensor domain-containing protein
MNAFRYHKILIAWLLLSPGGLMFGQVSQRSSPQFVFKHILSENISLEKGLSQNSVYSLAEDNEGLIWIGTWDGLNVYDGYNFKIFGKEHGLSNETIRTLHLSGRQLWIGTENGLNRMDMESRKIDVFYAIENDTNSLTNNWVNHIYEDLSGRIWISTKSGISEYLPETETFRRIFSRENSNPLRSNQFNMICQDSLRNYWLATHYGLVHYENNTGTISRYFHKPGDRNSLPDNQVNRIAADEFGNVWAGTKKGLVLYNKKNERIQHHFNGIDLNEQIGSVEIRSLVYEPSVGLWVGTGGYGLYFLDYKTNTFTSFRHDNSRIYSLSDNRIQHIMIDSQGIIWAGTFNGLNIIDRKAPRFRLYRNKTGETNTLANNAVWDFLETNTGHVWIATDDGISILDKTNDRYQHLKHLPDNPNSLPGKLIRSLYQDKEGFIWIGTRDKGLSRFDPKVGKFVHYYHIESDTGSLSNDYVLNIIEDRNGFLWVATENGLNRLSKANGRFKRYFQGKETGSLAHNHIYDLLLDRNGQLWVASADGLMLYDAGADQFKTFRVNSNDKPIQAHNTNKFLSVMQDSKGMFWLGTRGGGLVRFNPETTEFSQFVEEDGLAQNLVYGLVEDYNGNLWITTNRGLSRFNPLDYTFTNYDANDGLQSNEFNLNALLIASDGELFVGGMNGFNCFFPEDILQNPLPPRLLITAFRKFNIDQPFRPKDGDVVKLSYDDNFFSFEFAALDFRSPMKNKYRFKLENYDDGWIERAADKRYAEYSRVKPGNYNFRVTASNSDGYWNHEGINITIIIQPPWWASWWFRISTIMLVTILIYLIIQLRMRVLHRKHEREKEWLSLEKKMFELEQKALQLQMNPHFLFNSLNSIQSFVVNSDINNAIHYLSKFSQLMRKILSNSGESFITLRDEVQALELYLDIEKLRFMDKFEYKIIMDPEIDDEFVEIPPMILQPYVENAIIHGLMHSPKKGVLTITFSVSGSDILCVIQDDGIGREKADEIRKQSDIRRRSRGMLITGERLAILNQYSEQHYEVKVVDLKDENGHATGTRVEITLHNKE